MALSRVLLIDDDEAFRLAMVKALRRKGVEVVQASDGHAGMQRLMEQDGGGAQVAVLDLRMPGMDGMEVLERTVGRGIPVIVLTGHGSIPEAVRAMRLGAFSFLLKPVDADQLYEVLLQATGQSGSVTPELIGHSSGTKRLRELLNQLAPADDPVLLFGETGTGKEVAASYLHVHSFRATRPFVGVNVGGMPGELLESELFGHARGAFTGAERKKQGLFAAAEDGTLFLDEISELPLEHQVKLLRVIETRRFRPVGEAREEPLRARLIVATNRNLMAMVRAGTFREDLYYRLHVLPVEIPPLRTRREDILPIAELWLKRLLHRPVGFSLDAERVLLAYDYPGNVRELVNVVRRLALFVTGDQIEGALVQRMLAEDPFRQSLGSHGITHGMSSPGLAPAPLSAASLMSAGMSPAGMSAFGGAPELGAGRLNSVGSAANAPGSNAGGAGLTGAGQTGAGLTGAGMTGAGSGGAGIGGGWHSALNMPPSTGSWGSAPGGNSPAQSGSAEATDPGLSLKALEKLHIERLLREHRNVTQVARLLGIDRRTLQRKLKALDIEYDGRES